MALPTVAIIGRPNVGKSSMFNWIVGKRISIVDPTAGVTRDRVTSIIDYGERFFELMDTGGIGIVDSQDLSADVERQITLAIDMADVILYVGDARVGAIRLDQEVVNRLRPLGKPVICVVNKCDTDELDSEAIEFHRFGFQPVIAVSAEQNRGKKQLLNEIVRRLPPPRDEQEPDKVALRLAIVGRRNAGKSTFINSLAQADRVIVSEIPGTTRDSVDVRFERDGKTFIAIDTAGVRHRSSLANSIEFYSLARAERSIRNADVVLMFFDAQRTIGRIDKQLTGYILDHHKPAIFVFNKWDQLKDNVSTEEFTEYVQKMFPMLDYVPMAYTTAKDGRNVYKVLNLAQELQKQSKSRVTTGELNRVLRQALEMNPPAQKTTKLPKIYFASQVAVEPPTILLFCNNPELFDDYYRKYLIKSFRDSLPFAEVPIKLDFRARHGSKKSDTEEGVEEMEEQAAQTAKESKRVARKRKKPRDQKSTLWDV
jgi:GTPase